MYLNPEITAEIIPLYPQGTNSTLFTECCEVAICSDQCNCPKCGRLVVGHNEKNDGDRAYARWKSATRYWKR